MLKSRRHGISTILEFLAFWRSVFSADANVVIAAHEDDAAGTLFGMYKFFADSCPEVLLPPVVHRNANEIEWGGACGSIIRHRTVAPGGGTKEHAGKGRSQAIHFLHASEGAFWDEPVTFWTGISQCVEDYPGTVIAHESTANGFGWFHDIWQAAAAGWALHYDKDAGRLRWTCVDRHAAKSDLRPVFLSWLEEPKYRLPFETPEDRTYFGRHLDKHEAALKADFCATLEQLNWRRTTLYGNKFNGDLRRFWQEYPTTPEEAFVSSGRKVFDFSALQFAEGRARQATVAALRVRAELGLLDGRDPSIVPDEDGTVTIFVPPLKGHTYSIGLDASYGKSDGDYACAQVLDNMTVEQVAVFRVREAQQDEQAETVAALGFYYNEALIVPEVDGPGLAVLRVLDAEPISYPNLYRRMTPDAATGAVTESLGWAMSQKARRVMVAALRQYVVDMPKGDGLVLNDLGTIVEMQGWVTKAPTAHGGRVKEQPADAGGHDDRIIALGLALVGGVIENPAMGVPERPAPAPRVDPRQHDPLAARLADLMARGRSDTFYHPSAGAY